MTTAQRRARAANRARARRIATILQTTNMYEPGLTGAIDLLSDLRHYCDSQGLDFGLCDRRAYDHYLAEAHGEDEIPEDERHD
jgi:hypothetical protein